VFNDGPIIVVGTDDDIIGVDAIGFCLFRDK